MAITYTMITKRPEKGVTDNDTDDTDDRRSRLSLMQPLDRWSMAAKKRKRNWDPHSHLKKGPISQ